MKNKKKVGILLATSLLTLSMTTTANATPVSPHMYVEKEIRQTATGAYISISNDQEDLNHMDGQVITKEMWFPFSVSPKRWIEVGTTKGPIDSSSGYISDWHGHYMAWGNDTDYAERNFQSQSPTGTHNFQISKDGGNWTVYMDFSAVATVPIFNTYSSGIRQVVGIESSDTSNSFTNGTYASSLQYRDTAGKWVTWDTPGFSVYDTSTNYYNWYCTYNSSTNRITFNNQ